MKSYFSFAIGTSGFRFKHRLFAGLAASCLFGAPAVAQTTLIRVAQARVIGVNADTTFDANIVGVIKPWVTTQTAAGFYSYDTPIADSFNGPVPLTNDRIHFFFVQAADGLATGCVFDRPGNGNGGSAQMRRTVRPRGAAVQDLEAIDREGGWCSNFFFTGSSDPDSRYTNFVRQGWGADTDGWMMRLNSNTWTSVRNALMATPREYCDGLVAGCSDRVHYSGVTSMAAMSADGSVIPLALDQRVVEFQPVPLCQINAWPSQQARCTGSSASFSVRPNTTGSATFTWYRGVTPLTLSARITATTSADGLESRLNIANVTDADAGSYLCQVNSTCGSSFSNQVTLTITAGNPTTTNPSAAFGTCGGAASLSITAGGNGPFTFQWRKGTTVMHDFYSDSRANYRIVGTDQSTLQINNLLPEDAGSYTCVVTNACGSITSLPATISVLDNRPTFTQQPTPRGAQYLGSAQFSAAVSGGDSLATRWQRLNNNNWVNIDEGVTSGFATVTGVTGGSLQLTNITACDAVQIRQFASNSCGCTTSTAVTLTIIGVPPIPTIPPDGQPQAAALCPTGTAAFSVAATGTGPFTYQWQWQPAGPSTAWAALSNGINNNNEATPTFNVSGATTPTMNINSISGLGGNFRCIVTNACGSVTSNEATLSIVQPCGLADVAGDSLQTERCANGSIGPEDLDAFIAGFIADNTAIADVASDSLDTTFNPNGAVGPEDLDAFIASFIAGC